MIIVDVETGGLDPIKNPLFSIGAVDFETDEEFYTQITPVKGLEITDESLNINKINIQLWEGIPLEQAMNDFHKWLTGRECLLAGHNPRFDLDFLKVNFERCGLKSPFSYRTIDLHTLAYLKYGQSLTSQEIYQTIGHPIEPRAHHALTGAKWEAEAFDYLLSDFYKTENFVYRVGELLDEFKEKKA